MKKHKLQIKQLKLRPTKYGYNELLIEKISLLNDDDTHNRYVKLNQKLIDYIKKVGSIEVYNSGFKKNGTSFNTKKEAYDYYNNIRKKYNSGEKLNKKDEDEIKDLINNHPYKNDIIGSGISYIKVDSDAFKNKCFYVVDNIGNEVSFSPKTAINGKIDYRREFIRSARAEITEDIYKVRNIHLEKYKKGNLTMSAISGEWFPIEDIHVDHAKPQFKDIVEPFLNIINVRNVEYIKRNGNMDLFKNRLLANFWREYHKDIATLRIISAKENLTRKLNDNTKSIIPDLKIP